MFRRAARRGTAHSPVPLFRPAARQGAMRSPVPLFPRAARQNARRSPVPTFRRAAQQSAARSLLPLLLLLAWFRRAARANLAPVADRSPSPFAARAARPATDVPTAPAAPSRPPSGFGDIDPTEAGRAQAAANAVFSRFQGLIDALANDPSLTPEQRAAAIRGLRQQQTAEAKGAQKRIMDDARAAARLRRAMQRNRL